MQTLGPRSPRLKGERPGIRCRLALAAQHPGRMGACLADPRRCPEQGLFARVDSGGGDPRYDLWAGESQVTTAVREDPFRWERAVCAAAMEVSGTDASKRFAGTSF